MSANRTIARYIILASVVICATCVSCRTKPTWKNLPKPPFAASENSRERSIVLPSSEARKNSRLEWDNSARIIYVWESDDLRNWRMIATLTNNAMFYDLGYNIYDSPVHHKFWKLTWEN
jgi:hypothetical protein